MASVAIQSQDEKWIQGAKWSFSKFVYNVSAETVTIPVGTISAAAFVDSGTAPTATVTAGDTEDSVALTNGTVGKTVTLVCKHSGHVA